MAKRKRPFTTKVMLKFKRSGLCSKRYGSAYLHRCRPQPSLVLHLPKTVPGQVVQDLQAMNRKLKIALIGSILLTILLVFVSRNTSMLRYGNRATCGGTNFSSRFASWHRTDADAVLIFRNTKQFRFPTEHWLQLQILNPATGEIEQDIEFPIRSNIRVVTLSENEDVIAITRGFGESADTLLFSLKMKNVPERLATIRGAERTVWHSSEQMLAAIYYPEEYEHGSNIIALYDVSGAEPVQTDTFRLKRIAISQILGWSNDGQVIAVSQYDKNGEIPYYIFVDSGRVEKSLYRESLHNCVADGQWSPNEPILSFSGQNEDTEGWDIFLETVASPNSKEWSLVNLTNTPREDEVNVVWSPDGNHLAYVKVYRDAADNLRQELFVLNPNDALPTPIQLTVTPDALVDSPWWISDTEIAYLTWSPAELIWSLNTVSLDEPEPKKIAEIPQLWYSEP